MGNLLSLKLSKKEELARKEEEGSRARQASPKTTLAADRTAVDRTVDRTLKTEM